MKRALSLALCLFSLAALAHSEPENLTGLSPETLWEGRGARLVLVNFWATWCGPCKVEMRDLEALSKAWRDRGLLVVGLSVDGSNNASLVAKTVRALGVSYPVGWGAASSFRGRPVPVLPTTFLLGPDGAILEELSGRRDYRAFEKLVSSRLEKAPGSPSSGALSPARGHFNISAERKGRGGPVLLSLSAAKGFHLNGKGYPALELVLSVGGQSLGTLSAAGIGEGETKTWEVNAGAVDTITVTLRAVACDSSRCIPVNESLEVPISVK